MYGGVFPPTFFSFVGGYSARVIPASSFLKLADIARALFPPAIYEFFDGGFSARVIPANNNEKYAGGNNAHAISANRIKLLAGITRALYPPTKFSKKLAEIHHHRHHLSIPSG